MPIGYGKRVSWENATKIEKLRQKEMVLLKEYPTYFLCGKMKDGKMIYRECFMRIDIEGVRSIPRPRNLKLKYF